MPITGQRTPPDGATHAEKETAACSPDNEIGVLLSITLGLVIGRSIAGGVRAVQQMVTSMTDHCATYLENGLAALAIGDLTVQVTPVTEPIILPTTAGMRSG